MGLMGLMGLMGSGYWLLITVSGYGLLVIEGLMSLVVSGEWVVNGFNGFNGVVSGTAAASITFNQ